MNEEEADRPEQVTDPVNEAEVANQAGRIHLADEFEGKEEAEPEHNPDGSAN